MFVIYNIMKIWRKRLNQSVNELINDEAAPGLLNIDEIDKRVKSRATSEALNINEKVETI